MGFNTLHLEKYNKPRDEPMNSDERKSHSVPDIDQCVGHLASSFLPLACIGGKPQDCTEGKNKDLLDPWYKPQVRRIKTHLRIAPLE